MFFPRFISDAVSRWPGVEAGGEQDAAGGDCGGEDSGGGDERHRVRIKGSGARQTERAKRCGTSSHTGETCGELLPVLCVTLTISVRCRRMFIQRGMKAMPPRPGPRNAVIDSTSVGRTRRRARVGDRPKVGNLS